MSLFNKYSVPTMIMLKKTKIATMVKIHNGNDVVIFKIILSGLYNTIQHKINIIIIILYFLINSECGMLFNIFLDINLVFRKTFIKNDKAVAKRMPLIPKKLININDNTRFVAAQINMCLLLSLNRPLAFISANSG